MDKKTLIIVVVAGLAIAAAVTRLVVTQSSGSSRTNMKPYEHLGLVAAQETAKLVANQGSVTVVLEVMEGVKNPNHEAQLKGFKAGLGKGASLKLASVQELKRDMTVDPRTWSPNQAAQIVGMGAGASAVVLFASFPQALSPEDVAVLKANKGKLVVIATRTPAIDLLISQDIVQVAIAGRTPPKPPSGGTESTVQWFDRTYEILRSK